MKKKVKKIPKYATGTTGFDIKNYVGTPQLQQQDFSLGNTQSGPSVATGGSGFGGLGGTIGAAATAGGKMFMDAFGVEDNSKLGVTLNSSMQGAEIGGAIVPGWGHLAGGLIGGTIGALKKGKVDQTTGEIEYGGIFGRSKKSLETESNLIKTSNLARSQTQNIQADFMNNNPNMEYKPNVNAAKGAVIDNSTGILVSPDELIYDYKKKTLEKVPFGNGKPNTKDNVYTEVKEGEHKAIINNNAKMITTKDGKTLAMRFTPMIDKPGKKFSQGTIDARDAAIRKGLRLQESVKSEPQEYAKFSTGNKDVRVAPRLNTYGYDPVMSNFAYWDAAKNDYKKEYIDWVNKLTENDVKDIFSGKYGDMSTYLDKNKNTIPTVDEARKLMTDKRYGDWHKIGKVFVDSKLAPKNKMELPYTVNPIKRSIVGTTMYQDKYPDSYPIDYQVLPMSKPTAIPNPSEVDGITAANKQLGLQKPNLLNNIGETLSDYGPLIATLFKDYDYHQEPIIASNYKQLPIEYNIDDILLDNARARAISNYNISQMGGTGGRWLAAATQNAANTASANAKARVIQKNRQNELIAQNVGIYNNFVDKLDNATYRALTDTRANEAAADTIRRTDIKSALNWAQQRRRDRQLLPAYQQYLQYGMLDDTLKGIKV